MDTVLYNGFGGYHVMKGKELFYICDSRGEWDSFLTLADIEVEAKKNPKSKWQVILNNPLRGATWTRKKGRWVLTDTNAGFA